MKKILLLVIYPLIFISLILCYFFYNDSYSYSEQKREIYNEFLTYYFSAESFKNTDIQDDKLKEIFDKYVNLKNEAPDFDVKFSENSELNDTLFEGLTRYELEDWAEAHQSGDAFLCLSTLKSISPFEEEINRKKWLQKAVMLGRQGAGYLLSLNEKTKDVPYFSHLDYDTTNSQEFFSDTIMPIMTGISGYKEFRQAINDGDYMLYKTFESFVPIAFHSEIRKELECHLRKKAELGDLTAQMKLGDLIFNPPAKTETLYSKEIGEEISRALGLHVHIDPTSVSNMDRMVESIFNHNKKVVSKKWEELSHDIKILKQAADGGDRHAMCLWLLNAGKYCDFFPKKDWNDVFKFNEILLQEGHLGYMEKMGNYYPGQKSKKNPDLSSFIWEYYSQQSADQFFENMKVHIRKREKNHLIGNCLLRKNREKK